MTKAIIFVAAPACGKSTIAIELEKRLTNSVIIEQDAFYDGRRADNEAYLEAIRKECKTKKRKSMADNNRVLLLCKNHHTQKQRDLVIDILKQHNIKYYIVNLMPCIKSDSVGTGDAVAVIETLIDRVEKRSLEKQDYKKGGSHFVMKSRKQAYYILKKGFFDVYEEPQEKFLQLDFMESVDKNVKKILLYII
jgi:hypothetical protein